MALKFGLNVNTKAQAAAPSKVSAKRATIFDDEDDYDDEPEAHNHNAEQEASISVFGGSNQKKANGGARPARPTMKKSLNAPSQPPSLKNKSDDNQFSDLSANRASQKHAAAAKELDASIYDYDSFHDAHTSVSVAKKAADRQDALERKPKYINNLLESAARRKQDQLIAREKLLQKEREAEGDEFADKEKFVTGAYKAQQEEARRLEEEEKTKAEAEEKRRRERGGGMQGFYRSVMDDSEKRHREAMDAAQILEQQGKSSTSSTAPDADNKLSDAEIAAELKAKGVNVHVNEEGQVTDKRQLLTAGLNVAPAANGSDRGGADHLKTQTKSTQQAFQGRKNDQRGMRERQTRMLEQQLEESTKRAADDEAEERAKMEHAAKSRKTEGDISSAKERYLARKREAEAAKKNAG